MEQRKAERINTDLKIVLEPLDQEAKGSGTVTADVTDVSKSGIGFLTSIELKEHSFFSAKLVFQSKESVDTIIEIIRHDLSEEDNQIRYGGRFVGISEHDQFKIEVFRLFAQQEAGV